MLKTNPVKKGKFFAFWFGTFSLILMVMLSLTSSSTLAQSMNCSTTGINTTSQIKTDYNSFYSNATADLSKPLTVNLENHLYKPGNTVKIDGSVLLELVKQVSALNLVTIQVKDGSGNIVDREAANISSTD